MKIKIATYTGVAALLLALAIPALADDKIVTITGEGKCAKCALKETDTCQNVIQTEADGKKVTYYLTKNDISNSFHKKNLCEESKKVTATGTVKEVNGKQELTVTKLELATK
jgi:hypothetical protein